MKACKTTMQVALALCLLLASTAFSAGVPHLMNIQGILTDEAGTPVLDDIHMVDFSIYDVESGGAALWTESRAVATNGGLFNMVLGEVNPIPASLFSGADRWLGMALTGSTEMTPRQRLTAAPYVYRALNADSAGFAFAIANNSVTSGKIANGSILFADLGQNGAASGQVIKWNGSAWSAANDETGGGGGWVDDGSVVRLSSSADKVGIGVTDPQEKLHVAGDIRLNAGNDIAFGNDSTSIYETGGDLVLTANDDIHLNPDDDLYIRRDGGSAWVHFDNSAGKLGIGILNPAYKLTVQGEISIASGGASKYHINYYDGGLNFAETGVQDRRIHISDGGNVGIGTANPGAKLGVNGNLKVNGAYIGNISSSTDTSGAPFPRQAYNSGWLEIAQGATLFLTHDIGGDVDDYLIDFQVWNPMEGIHSIDNVFLYSHIRGAYYFDLTSSQISVKRWADDVYVEKIRVRIWVVK
jgi:hypothetical protein